jgi:ABC-2 type transport system permease protein
VAWIALTWCALLGQFGALLNLSQWVLDLSPFTHIPHVPGGTVAALPLLTLTLIAAVLIAVGVGAFRTRDVPQT